MAKLVDAKDLKSFEPKSHVGSSPTVPTKSWIKPSKVWFDEMRKDEKVFDKFLSQLREIELPYRYLLGPCIPRPAPQKLDEEISVAITVTHDRMVRVGQVDIERYIKNQMANEIAQALIDSDRVEWIKQELPNQYETEYRGRFHIFTEEQMKLHDQDVIEEYLNRK